MQQGRGSVAQGSKKPAAFSAAGVEDIRRCQPTCPRYALSAIRVCDTIWENRWAGLDRSLSEISPWLGHGQSLKGKTAEAA